MILLVLSTSYNSFNTTWIVHLISEGTVIYYPNIIHPYSLPENGGFTIFDNGHSIEKIIKLEIYDRWGEFLWSAENIAPNNPSLGWNGKFRNKDISPGVYAWKADLRLKSGGTISKHGDVTVVR